MNNKNSTEADETRDFMKLIKLFFQPGKTLLPRNKREDEIKMFFGDLCGRLKYGNRWDFECPFCGEGPHYHFYGLARKRPQHEAFDRMPGGIGELHGFFSCENSDEVKVSFYFRLHVLNNIKPSDREEKT